jgi:hypothetical protein
VDTIPALLLRQTAQAGGIPKDDKAVAFYRHFGFAPSTTDARHLFMIIKDIRVAAGEKP